MYGERRFGRQLAPMVRDLSDGASLRSNVGGFAVVLVRMLFRVPVHAVGVRRACLKSSDSLAEKKRARHGMAAASDHSPRMTSVCAMHVSEVADRRTSCSSTCF